MKIDVRKPEGNVFVILGRLQHLRDELVKLGSDVREYDDLLETATTMKYGQILDRIETVTHGMITFVGRESSTSD